MKNARMRWRTIYSSPVRYLETSKAVPVSSRNRYRVRQIQEINRMQFAVVSYETRTEVQTEPEEPSLQRSARVQSISTMDSYRMTRVRLRFSTRSNTRLRLHRRSQDENPLRLESSELSAALSTSSALWMPVCGLDKPGVDAIPRTSQSSGSAPYL